MRTHYRFVLVTYRGPTEGGNDAGKEEGSEGNAHIASTAAQGQGPTTFPCCHPPTHYHLNKQQKNSSQLIKQKGVLLYQLCKQEPFQKGKGLTIEVGKRTPWHRPVSMRQANMRGRLPATHRCSAKANEDMLQPAHATVNTSLLPY